MLEPIFFKPIYKQVVWGGNNIKNFLSRKIEEKNIGESWEISAHSNGISQIINEAFNNENLYELFIVFSFETKFSASSIFVILLPLVELLKI